MNDFDQFLELKLRHLLDPVVAGRPPARRARPQKPQQPILTLAVEAIAVVEAVVVALPVAASRRPWKI